MYARVCGTNERTAPASEQEALGNVIVSQKTILVLLKHIIIVHTHTKTIRVGMDKDEEKDKGKTKGKMKRKTKGETKRMTK